jgi:SAM-dependent methyltransferase
MNPKLQRVQQLLRKLHLLDVIEAGRYAVSLARTRRRNEQFKRENPDFALPPAHLAFDAYSAPDWPFYKASGLSTAEFIKSAADEHLGPGQTEAVLEWGCGPGRVIRHLPAVFGPDVRVAGCDYNPESVAWCKEHIDGVEFAQNGLQPPAPFEPDVFSVVYAISVFTHLSKEVCDLWSAELHRLLKPGGVALISTKGDSYLPVLLPEERKQYDEEGIVVRGGVKEGKKLFGAFHSPKYVEEHLLGDFQIVQHVGAGFPHVKQDLWIARKPAA